MNTLNSLQVGGVWDISNADRLGRSEIELVNIFIEGMAKLIELEQKLEQAQDIEADVKKVKETRPKVVN